MTKNKGLYAAYPKKVQGMGQTLAVAGVFCCLLVCTGCSGSAQNAVASKLAGPRIDWGMSLLASGSNGVGMSPAKFTFDITAAPDCTNDFIAYNTGAAGAAGTAKIVAFNSLYSTQGSAGGLCDTNGPSVYWAYDTAGGSAAQALTSPVLSGDGSKIAFVDNSGSGATLRVLKWKAGEGTGVGTPATPDQDISGMSWSACMVGNSCVASIAFNNVAGDTNSPPFYNYSTDVLYVGDNTGVLHKFTGVFKGTPTEITSGGWPLTVDSTTVLTGPVFDSVSGNIYIGDSSGVLSMIREVGSTVGTCTAPCVNSTLAVGGAGGGIVDTPIVDGTNEFVFAVNGREGTNGGTILQASTDFSTSVVSFNIGNDTGDGAILYGGAFDNTYINSSAPSVAGHMYVCGKYHLHFDEPAIYQLSFTGAGVLSGVGTPLINMTQVDDEACSPITEVYNGGTSKDWIFFSIGNNVNTGGAPIPAGSCATNGGGCVIGIDVTGGPSWPPANVNNTASVPANPTGSTSGIVVDNVSTSSQASNIYFSLGGNSTGTGPGLPSCNTTAGVGCAVKLTQSTLQ